MQRRKFLTNASILGGSMLLAPSILSAQRNNDTLISVLGPIKPDELGITLIHEHVMADFIGAAQTGTHRYDTNAVFEKALPHLIELKKAGCKTFIDCTPVYLGSALDK